MYTVYDGKQLVLWGHGELRAGKQLLWYSEVFFIEASPLHDHASLIGQGFLLAGYVLYFQCDSGDMLRSGEANIVTVSIRKVIKIRIKLHFFAVMLMSFLISIKVVDSLWHRLFRECLQQSVDIWSAPYLITKDLEVSTSTSICQFVAKRPQPTPSLSILDAGLHVA